MPDYVDGLGGQILGAENNEDRARSLGEENTQDDHYCRSNLAIS